MPSRHFGRPSLLLALLVAGACTLSTGCAGPPPASVEGPPSAKAEVEPTTTKAEEPPPPTELQMLKESAMARPAPDFSPPGPAEVSDAVERVFKGAVTVETGRDTYFIAGDFNGDSSQDVAVVVRPVPEKLSEINDELARWVLVAPVSRAANEPPYTEAHAETLRRRRVVVDDGDVLLAVIHGFESKGWRDPQATQTYVLKDAAGETMKTWEKKLVAGADNRERLPRLWGDVIAQEIGGEGGFLYYNGAKYEWFNPRRDQPAAPLRMAHGGPSAPKQQ